MVPLQILAFAFAFGLAFAQAPPAAAPEPAAPPPPPPPKLSYRYEGKPIVLQTKCGDAELSDYAMSCSEEEPCPLYIELATADASGSKLFVSGNLHADAVTLWSVLLMSADGGQSWTEPFERMRATALDLTQFPDFATGFVSGHSAGTLPKDPFLLRTSDGGKSWTRLPILEEGVVGLIERLHFESATRGLVEVDRGRPGAGRYVILETQNGGDSWAIKESSATRPPRPSREPLPLIRIVADAASKSFRIERREGASWRTAAAFSVAAGSCRPASRVESAEPPASPPYPLPLPSPSETAPPGQLH